MATLVLFNKPFHVLSQFSDDQGRMTVKDFITDYPSIYPAGRLDYDSEGLLLLTDSGTLQHRISHPNHKLNKTYWVQVEGVASQAQLKQLRQGVVLKDGLTAPARVQTMTPPQLWLRNPPIRQRKNIPDCWLSITLTEGRNRQIRRMTAAVGLPTLRLVRVQIGDWKLGDLQPGDYVETQVHLPRQNSNKPYRGK